jgi:hypothetical protein
MKSVRNNVNVNMYIFFRLFNSTFSIETTVLADRDVLERIWKEDIMAQ